MNAEFNKKILQHLKGKWHLSRNVSGSHVARVTGVAVFEETIHPNELKYSEEVEMTLAEGAKFNGHQRYIYRLEGEGKLNVYFEDERLFHSLDFTDSNHQHEHKARHDCQPDTYITSYIFGENAFQIEHRVKGSKKDYLSCTHYTSWRI